MRRTIICVMLASLVISAVSPAATYYVAAAGNDGSPGTFSQPWRTIQKAASTMTAGDTCYIRGGTYYEQVRLPYSGSSGSPISFIGYEGESVTILPGAAIGDSWTSAGGNKYYRWLGWEPLQVFVDGQALHKARWPNQGTAYTRFTAPRKTVDSASSDNYIADAELTQSANYWVGGKIHITPGAEWVSWVSTITASASGSLWFQPLGTPTWAMPEAGDTYCIFDCFNALDTAAEYWYDASSGTLWMICPDYGNPNGKVVEVVNNHDAFTANSANPMHYIRVQRIAFRGATIGTLWGSDNWDISGCKFDNYHYSDACNGFLSDIYNSGLNLVGGLHDNHIIVHNEFNGSSDNGISIEGNNNVIRSNVVINTGYMAGGSAVYVLNGYNGSISNNRIWTSGRMGVNMASGYNVKYNDLKWLMQLTCDGGAIYSFNGNGLWNHIAYNRVDLQSWKHYTFAIYMDNGSTQWWIHHNDIFNFGWCGLFFNGAGDGVPATSYCWGLNNTLYGDPGQSFATLVDRGSSNGMWNNIASRAEYGNGSYMTNKIGGNPGLNNPAAGDFTLAPGSSCINAGTHYAGITDGYVGNAPDIGAHEYGLPNWTPLVGINNADLDRHLAGDYDGDGTCDLAIWRPNTSDNFNARFIIKPSSGSLSYQEHGGIQWWNNDIPIVGDFDGDGKDDKAIYRQYTGHWYIIPSSGGGMWDITHGGYTGDIPMVGDFNGDGRDDYVILRLNSGLLYWHIVYSSGGTTSFAHGGYAGDIPLILYRDADNKADAVILRNVNGIYHWYVRNSTGGMEDVAWGTPGMVYECSGDYTGDGRDEITMVDTSQSTYRWYMHIAGGGGSSLTKDFGEKSRGDVPVTSGNYTGSGVEDMVVIQPGVFSIYRWKDPGNNATGTASFGNFLK